VGAKDAPEYPDTEFKVLKACVLHLMDFEANNNKFYSMEIHEANVHSLAKFVKRRRLKGRN